MCKILKFRNEKKKTKEKKKKKKEEKKRSCPMSVEWGLNVTYSSIFNPFHIIIITLIMIIMHQPSGCRPENAIRITIKSIIMTIHQSHSLLLLPSHASSIVIHTGPYLPSSLPGLARPRCLALLTTKAILPWRRRWWMLGKLHDHLSAQPSNSSLNPQRWLIVKT